MDFFQLGKQPIDSDTPVGSDIRYEPEFEKLQAEIDKLSSPSASSGISWENVADLSSKILAEKSKDLLVASYFAVSQVHTDKVEGLAVGLTVMHDLVANYWDNLFPAKKRMRGRLGAFEWWLGKTETALEKIKPGPLDQEKRDVLNGTLNKLEGFLNELLPDPPLLRPIFRYIETIPIQGGEDPEEISHQEESVSNVQVADTSDDKPPSVSHPPPQPVASVPSTASSGREIIETADAARRAVHETLAALSRNSIQLAEFDISQPLPYRCRRMGIWAKLETLPPATKGLTRLPPPPEQVIENIKHLYGEGKWEALLRTTERNFAQYIFWLDLNRFSAEAMLQLGASYEMAHDTICQETVFFVHRLEGVETLAFSDGMPFADEATKQWLNNNSPGSENVAAEPIQNSQSIETDNSSTRLAETVETAQQLVKDKKVLDAVKMFQDELADCSAIKSAFPWRLALCRILLGSKKPQWAIPHLELILNDINAYRLESWEPDLALQGLMAAWRGFNHIKNEALNEKTEAILHRIAKLNPVEALRLNS